jgi:uncharacterized protein YdaU (DUF1376 family)
MDSYTRNIAKFEEETAGLSLRELGAYNRMLDIYYATERPLPLSQAMLCMALRCTSAEDRAAVTRVVRKFWKETQTGWIRPEDQYAGGWVVFHSQIDSESGARH